jgi:protein-S-isoprenylcysteine O-methyltransferase Ste14
MNTELLFRLLFLLILLPTLTISSYYRRKARQSGETIPRRAEGGTMLALRLLGALPLLVMFLLTVFYPRWLTWATFNGPLWLRWLGVGIGVACVPLVWWVFSNIRGNISETVLTKKAHQLVTSGPYHWVRHPLYAVALLEFFALGLLANNWVIMLYALLGVVIFRWVVIPKEEQNLIKAFGEQYAAYQQRTGALLPRIR